MAFWLEKNRYSGSKRGVLVRKENRTLLSKIKWGVLFGKYIPGTYEQAVWFEKENIPAGLKKKVGILVRKAKSVFWFEK